jgi:hypothetical protein
VSARGEIHFQPRVIAEVAKPQVRQVHPVGIAETAAKGK